jgi:hypothetical protein
MNRFRVGVGDPALAARPTVHALTQANYLATGHDVLSISVLAIMTGEKDHLIRPRPSGRQRRHRAGGSGGPAFVHHRRGSGCPKSMMRSPKSAPGCGPSSASRFCKTQRSEV